MNTGEFPEGMSAERRDLVEALECLGFDTDEQAVGDWRTTFSDADLRAAVERLSGLATSIIDDRYAPIATAPRDGTSIIVAHEDVGAFPVRWEPNATNELFAPGCAGLWVGPGGTFTWSEHDGLGPSHWRAA